MRTVAAAERAVIGGRTSATPARVVCNPCPRVPAMSACGLNRRLISLTPAGVFAFAIIMVTAFRIHPAGAEDQPVVYPRRYCENGFERAGYPQDVACRAQPSDTPAYCGYTVGGGAPHHGEPRYLDEGTWGWDYTGWLFQRRVGLDWFHGARYQGGAGAYKTDGPRLLH